MYIYSLFCQGFVSFGLLHFYIPNVSLLHIKFSFLFSSFNGKMVLYFYHLSILLLLEENNYIYTYTHTHKRILGISKLIKLVNYLIN